MKLKNIIEFMNGFAPEITAYDWDNVGLLVGEKDKNVNKILVSLDVTKNVIEEAIIKKADLIISHHPFIFRPINTIVDDDVLGSKIISVIKNDISVYSAHTNLDLADGGTNDTLFDILNLENKKGLQKLDENNLFLGRVGELRESVSFETFAEFIKEKLNLTNIVCVKSNENKIKRIGIATGSCGSMSFFLDALKNRCDVLVTSDIKHHDAIDAMEMGLNLIDATHYATEFVVVKTIYNKLNKFAKDMNEEVTVMKSEYDKPIFAIL